uniref:Uncharacterized protein n=1 Tax=Parascaris univalens TaxID=6257 RepID=A0A915AYU3_PARUN
SPPSSNRRLSTQRDTNGTNITQQYDFMKVARDFGNQRNTSVTTNKGQKNVENVSTDVEGQLLKRRGRPPKSRELISRSGIGSDGAQQLTSRRNVISKVNNSIVEDEKQSEAEGIRSKRIKLEPIDVDVEENRNDSGDKKNYSDGDIGDMKMEEEQEDDGLIIGLDIETLRRKLAKAVEYSNLERRKPVQTQISHNGSTNSDGGRSRTTST